MNLADKIKDRIFVMTTNLGRRRIIGLPPLNLTDIEKITRIVYNVGKFLLIFGEILALGWFFTKYLPNKIGTEKAIISLILLIYIQLWLGKFKTR